MMKKQNLNPPYHPKDRDEYAKYALGYKTPDDVQKGMEQGNFIYEVFSMMDYMRRLEETEQTLKADDKDWYIISDRPSFTAGESLNGYQEDFSYYRDIKIDPETAEVSFLPNNSNEWVSREEFERISPDYKAGMDYYLEFRLAIRTGQNTGIKYIENFIAGLNAEERDWIKNSNMFGSPAFRNLGVEGLNYFETSYDNIDGVRKRCLLKDEDFGAELYAKINENNRKICEALEKETGISLTPTIFKNRYSDGYELAKAVLFSEDNNAGKIFKNNEGKGSADYFV